MQIISGQARGIIMSVPSSGEVRPTAGRARKALFDSLGPWNNAKVLDIFAGSGALGIEAASRGATDVCFVEKNKRHIQYIQQNIQKVQKAGVEASFEIKNIDALSIQKLPFTPSIIFADPPYAISEEIFHQIVKTPFFKGLPSGVLLLWEIPENAPCMKGILVADEWKTIWVKNYGSIWFLALTKG